MATTEHALLVHGYCDDWPSEDENPDRPDNFSRFQVQAAVELVKERNVAVVVFALGTKTSK